MPKSSGESAILRSSCPRSLFRPNMDAAPLRSATAVRRSQTGSRTQGSTAQACGKPSKTCTIKAVATTGAARLTNGTANSAAITMPPTNTPPAEAMTHRLYRFAVKPPVRPPRNTLDRKISLEAQENKDLSRAPTRKSGKANKVKIVANIQPKTTSTVSQIAGRRAGSRGRGSRAPRQHSRPAPEEPHHQRGDRDSSQLSQHDPDDAEQIDRPVEHRPAAQRRMRQNQRNRQPQQREGKDGNAQTNADHPAQRRRKQFGKGA